MKRHIAVAITGASGAVYGIRLIEELLAAGCRVSILISKAGFLVLREECGLEWAGDEAAMNATLRDHFKADVDSLAFYSENISIPPLPAALAPRTPWSSPPAPWGALPGSPPVCPAISLSGRQM